MFWRTREIIEDVKCEVLLKVIVAPLQIPKDLVHGEFLQLGAKESEDERFAHYLKKTFLKTASLMAFSCKAVS